jgi:hypothetical protein
MTPDSMFFEVYLWNRYRYRTRFGAMDGQQNGVKTGSSYYLSRCPRWRVKITSFDQQAFRQKWSQCVETTSSSVDRYHLMNSIWRKHFDAKSRSLWCTIEYPAFSETPKTFFFKFQMCHFYTNRYYFFRQPYLIISSTFKDTRSPTVPLCPASLKPSKTDLNFLAGRGSIRRYDYFRFCLSPYLFILENDFRRQYGIDCRFRKFDLEKNAG